MDRKTDKKLLELADCLHSAAIHLLRRLRTEDRSSGLSPPRLSALSVLVFRGPQTVSDLARIEQVKMPTMSRLLKDMEQERLVTRRRDRRDERRIWLRSTPKGRRLMREGRDRRVRSLAKAIQSLPQNDKETLRRAAALMDKLAKSED